ncbi:hypothetical protein E3P89_02795 [Wallemia ichthyophaga]|uniref:Transcription initiation factor TFIID subunit 13 n=2 Tax=Wallemia ichthyophaga TaxID=245174 RepID=A0A4T0HA24_WALIC|nr:hypothetical protein E3P90_02811 [Wallemia ichthyophaga]TIB10599.1 hypothetical protein E3P93_02819 [Wallemia ichthyophaga]TIB21120.1 hypothetical protein E3P89_02795 [Wallemia ichthyophaga]TIB22799.1 hypothetical protein E3P88_02830 [Wallemia ichthyophaga]
MYSFGDDVNPDPEATNVLEEILIDFIMEICYKSQKASGNRGKIKIEDIKFVLRNDTKKLNRVEELLYMQEDIKRARAAFNEDSVPRGSHSFLSLFNAYNQVLDAHGIDQNDEVELYDLLLKLGVVRGRDWFERWQAIVNSEYSEYSEFSIHNSHNIHNNRDTVFLDHSSSPTLSNSSHSHSSHSHSTSTAALAADARQTDKEYPPIQYEHSSHRSPQTLHARAMASVHAQTNRVRQSQIAQRRQEHQHHQRTQLARKRELDEARQRADENKVLREMESAADALHNQNILTRTFNAWFGLFRWIHESNVKVETVQQSRIRSTFFHKWQYALNSHVFAATHVAVSHDNTRITNDTLKLWKIRLRHRLRHRKENRLRTTYVTIRKGIAKRLMEKAWQLWRQATDTRRADMRYSYATMSAHFKQWKQRTIQVLEKDSLVVELATIANERRAARFLNRWKQRCILQTRERQYEERWRGDATRTYFDAWKYRTDTNKAAAAWRDASAVRTAFYAWQRKLYTVQKFTALADTFSQDRHEAIRRQTIHQWQLSLKCFTFHLSHMHTLGQLVLQYWYSKMQDVQERELVAEEYHFVHIRELGVGLFDRWKSRWGEVRVRNGLAVEFRQVNSQHVALKKWMRNYQHKRMMNRRGYVLRRMIQKKNAFYGWRMALSRKRQEEWIGRRELTVKKDSWNVWRNRFGVLCDLRAREDLFKAERTHKTLTSAVLQKWLQRTIDSRDVMYSADMLHERKRKKSVMQQWRAKNTAVQGLHSAGAAYREAKEENTRRGMLARWQRRTQLGVERSRKSFEAWYDQIKTLELEAVETEMLILRRERMLHAGLARWMSVCAALPAVRHYNTSLKTRTLRLWNAQLPSARNARLAAHISRRESLTKWLGMWRDNVQIKRSRRAIARARTLGKRPSASRLKQAAARAEASATPSPELGIRRPFSRPQTHTNCTNHACLPPSSMFIASRHLPPIKPGRIPSIEDLERVINSLRAIYTSTVAGIKVSNPTQGVDGWSSIHANDDGENVYASDTRVQYAAENEDDSFERKWSSNWLTRLIALSEEWLGEVEAGEGDETTEAYRERERVVEMAAAALACVAGMSAAGPIDRTFNFIGRDATPFEIVMHDNTVNGHEDVGAQTWGAAVHLSRLVCRYPDHFGVRDGSRLLEVGAGTGLVGIACAQMASQLDYKRTQVVLSDYLSDIIANLRRNVQVNRTSTPTHVTHLDWNSSDSESALGTFDTMFGADVCYDLSHAYMLHNAAAQLLSKQGTFHVLIALRKTHVGMKESVEDAFSGRFIQPDGDALCIDNTDLFDVEKGLGRADELGYARFEIKWKSQISTST